MKPVGAPTGEPLGGFPGESAGPRIGRVGLLGGTFDPIHLGHLRLARLSITERRLDRLYFLPAFAPPHKTEREISDFQARAEMLKLALADEDKMDICLVEKELPLPSYTITTLRHLTVGYLSGCQVFFVIGSDSLFDLPTWRGYEDILATVHLLVARRPGCGDLTAMVQRLGYHIDGDRCWRSGKKDIFFLSGEVPAVSSSALRAALRRGEECSLLPPTVAAWLQRRRLYEK